MKKQIAVLVKLTFELDANLDTESTDDFLSQTVITGCQNMAELITKPVEILDIKGEA